MKQGSAQTIYQAALGKRVFMLEQCRDCGRFVAPPEDSCPWCGEDDMRWIEAAGWGLVLSAAGEAVPGTGWASHRIALDEGVEIVAPVIDPPPGEIHPGMKVYAHVGLHNGQPQVLFAGHTDEDEW